ncbi:hypothetical protein FSP39_016145 [Pinctada imbricata]|uniref:BRCA1-associated protein n=1 Tax=Pinctada imbricata TaxID=66713 RepID=A0AA88XFZ0_PINIB|nr:hypothetical protein FSP39_016145 [Pinctada imbricata]
MGEERGGRRERGGWRREGRGRKGLEEGEKASHFKRPITPVEDTTSKQKSSTYAAVAGSSPREEDKGTIQKECQGQREYTEITIESYFNTLYIDPEETKVIEIVPLNTQEAEMSGKKSKHHSDKGQLTSKKSKLESDTDSENVQNKTETEKTEESDNVFQPIETEDKVKMKEKPNSRPGSGNFSQVNRQSPVSRGSPTMNFFSGNPMVERTTGILHVYKDNQMTPIKTDTPRSELICMLAVPAMYTIHDLVKFTAPVEEGIEYMRIIRDSKPNQYMVLVKFRNQKLADEFFSSFNNVPYNSIESDILCHLIYVAKVETVKDTEGACLPVPGLTELPNCPVCLERMDESVDGILTILCNHAFHMKCLAQWGDTSCPVCRYCQTPEEVQDNSCMICGSNESLWICLICGHVGCGRYVDLHAYRHFQATGHTYSMNLGTNQVWDYVGDNFVHRLVQSKGDGKLVAVDDQGSNGVDPEKMDSLSLEYTYLLTSQLDSQRKYFEEKMKQVEKNALERVSSLEKKFKKATEDSERFQSNLQSITKEKQQVDNKCKTLHTRLTTTLKDLQEEREMNKSLLQNQQAWQTEVESARKKMHDLTTTKEMEIQELREQLRDIMFYMEAQQKLASTTEVTQEEIQEGHVIVGATGNSPSARNKKGRKKTGK